MFVIAGGFLLLYVNLYNNRKKRHLEEKLRLREDFERELVIAQAEVQEQTLQTVAADLHDNIGQLLSLVKMTLSSVDIRNADRAEAKVSDALLRVDDAIRDLRQLASVMQAHNILAGGLVEAMRKELAWIERNTGLGAGFTITGTPYDIDGERALIVFRLLQELISNCIRHAKAKSLSLVFNYGADALQISFKDDGCGFDGDKIPKTKSGLGMGNLHRRAAMIEAPFSISSSPGNGTLAQLSLRYQIPG